MSVKKNGRVQEKTISKENVFVVAGGPATGKSTLISGLRSRGFKCLDEVAREIIDEQLKTKGTIVPWLELGKFNEEVIRRMVKQHCSVSEEIHFFDRGFPDNLGYLKLGGANVSGDLFDAAKKYRYNKKVFFLEPWENIYLNDATRKEPFEYALKISDHIKEAYIELDYDVVVVPKVSVEERVEFVLKHVLKKKK